MRRRIGHGLTASRRSAPIAVVLATLDFACAHAPAAPAVVLPEAERPESAAHEPVCGGSARVLLDPRFSDPCEPVRQQGSDPSVDPHPTELGCPAFVDGRLRFEARDGDEVFGVTFAFRPQGEKSFHQLHFPSPGPLFTVDLRAFEREGTYEWYIESQDLLGNGPTRLGSLERPLRFQVRSR